MKKIVMFSMALFASSLLFAGNSDNLYKKQSKKSLIADGDIYYGRRRTDGNTIYCKEKKKICIIVVAEPRGVIGSNGRNPKLPADGINAIVDGNVLLKLPYDVEDNSNFNGKTILVKGFEVTYYAEDNGVRVGKFVLRN
jgi:hypothetical protein